MCKGIYTFESIRTINTTLLTLKRPIPLYRLSEKQFEVCRFLKILCLKKITELFDLLKILIDFLFQLTVGSVDNKKLKLAVNCYDAS